MQTTSSQNSPSAQELVIQLMDRGYSALTISDLMGRRVSWRTIYRWAKGEARPHQPSDLAELRRVATALLEEQAPTPTLETVDLPSE
jgi:hypothetical protein